MQQNYIDAARDLESMALAAEYISTGDMINSHIKMQQWGLLPEVGMMMSTAPSILLTGKPHFVKFPDVWPKQSVANKTKRMMREIKASCGVAF